LRTEARIRNPKSAIRNQAGFTLVEVMIAMAIIGVTAVVLLQQRIEIVRDAARARDLRTAWILTSQKMAELELDPTLWTGTGQQSNGDFSEVSQEYGAFYWEYQIVREQLDLSDPADPRAEKKIRELLRLTLMVRGPNAEPVVVEAQFPIQDPKAAEPPPAEGGTPPPSGSQPAPQPPAGGKK
jgi:prepilin-type N-terminal cleavage/methylation domain-containing protein